MTTFKIFSLIPVILFSVSLSAQDILPNNKLLGLWQYQSSEIHIHFLTTSGLVVFTDNDKSTTLGYIAPSPAKGEYITFKKANGEGTRIYGFSRVKFISNDLIEVAFVRKPNGPEKIFRLTRQQRSNPAYANSSFYSWKKDQLDLKYSLTGTWVTTKEVLSIYDDGLWLSVYPDSGDRYGGFLSYEKDDYRQFRLHFGTTTFSKYRMRNVSQHEFQLVTEDGIVLTYYRRSWTPGDTVELAPSASSLLFAFLGAVLSGDDSTPGESSFDRNLREAQRAKENAYEERRRNGGY